MKTVVAVGAQWGDEGKGKIVDWLAQHADLVARFQGGNNAGHTLVVAGGADDTIDAGPGWTVEGLVTIDAQDFRHYAQGAANLIVDIDIDSSGIGVVVAPVALSAVATGSGGFKIIGENLSNYAGVSVSSAGDVNGDGFADLIVGADGVNSTVRMLLEEQVRPSFDWRPNRFVWLGTTKSFPAFTFYFRENEHGLWRVHAYQYEPGSSAFIVECTEDTWRSSGMDEASEEQTAAHCETLFREELDGHPLIRNRSLWRSFPTIRCERWSVGNVVLIGDAVHTAHYSVGSGTRMAMMDAIALRNALAAVNGGWPVSRA